MSSLALPRRPNPPDLMSRVLAEGFVLAVLLAWYLAARRLPAVVLPGPLDVARSGIDLLREPDRLLDVGVTILRVLASVISATLIGGALAIVPFQLPVLRSAILRQMQPLLNAMPSAGWAILGSIWFGVSDGTVIFIQTAILVPFCLVNIAQGMQDMDAELLEMGASFSRSRWRVLRHITLPLLAPYAIAAARMAYGVCWKVALVSELFGAEVGMGNLMYQAQVMSDTSQVLATCLVIVALFGAGEALVLAPLARRWTT